MGANESKPDDKGLAVSESVVKVNENIIDSVMADESSDKKKLMNQDFSMKKSFDEESYATVTGYPCQSNTSLYYSASEDETIPDLETDIETASNKTQEINSGHNQMLNDQSEESKSADIYHIKIVEIEPKLTLLGSNLDEAIKLQRDHDELLKQIQGKKSPIDEFTMKADKLLAENKARKEVIDAMGHSIEYAWNDVLKLFEQRKIIIDLTENFHEKMSVSSSKMSALEMACKDTMIPIEIESVQEFLCKFKQLRIDVLASIMSTLKDGNELLAHLRELCHKGTLDSRPDYLAADAKISIVQVEEWLDILHDRRNVLEVAWQSRKTQLEQCLALAILVRDLNDLEQNLLKHKNVAMTGSFNLGDSVTTATLFLEEYLGHKHDAISLRDKALRIARATEKLVSSGSFAGDEANAKAYNVLDQCMEYIEFIENRENLLSQSKDFFKVATTALNILEKLEIELSTTKLPPGCEESAFVHSKVMNDLQSITSEPLKLGYNILNYEGRCGADTTGIRRVIEEIENRKIYLERICSTENEQHLKITQAFNGFLERYNALLGWLLSDAENCIKSNIRFGRNIDNARDFLKIHHQLLSDLEKKGTAINNLLVNLSDILESLDAKQRKDIDQKVDSLKQHWTMIEKYVEKRVDLVRLYIKFLEEAHVLSDMFDYLEAKLAEIPEHEKMDHLELSWVKIKNCYDNLKNIGKQFLIDTTKITEPYLDVKAASENVEDVLNGFSNRQIDITNSWENWVTTVTEKRETELLIERTMTENIQVLNSTKKLDEQLYPVLNTDITNLELFRDFVHKKQHHVYGEIESAITEIEQRINTTSQINREHGNDKFAQIVENLESIRAKLKKIVTDYRVLLNEVVVFLEKLIIIQRQIGDYFSKNRSVPNHNIEDEWQQHEVFRENVLRSFREVISMSERIIDKIRDLEPVGVREHDTDTIIRLLENLRIEFETQDDQCSKRLNTDYNLAQFKKKLADHYVTLNNIKQQLEENKSQYGETLAGADAVALAFEYFEKTMNLTDNQFKNFYHNSEEIYKKHPDTELYIKPDLNRFMSEWDQLRNDVSNVKNKIGASKSYYSLLNEVNINYREYERYLYDQKQRLINCLSPLEGDDLMKRIDNYISEHEPQQLEKLRSLSEMSRDIYGHDKSTEVYNDNLTLFQSFFTLKNELIEKIKVLEQKSKDVLDRVDINGTEQLPELIEQKAEVFQKPFFRRPLENSFVQEGDRFVFECVIDGIPKPRVEWFKDGISIGTNTDYKTILESDGVCRLQIEESFAADSAYFTCRGYNSVGENETTAFLTVKETEAVKTPPKFIKPLESVIVNDGSIHEFNCIVSGHPLPVVQWYKNDTCIDNFNEYDITYNNGEAKLRLQKVLVSDQATYTCKAFNDVGQSQCAASLQVRETLIPTKLPYFKLPLSNIMARVGQKIKLECAADGIPLPELSWTHNGKTISSRDKRVFYENNNSILTISEAFPKDGGVYVVCARNSVGEALTSCNVNVKGRIPNETSDSELASDMEPIKPSVQLPLKDVSIFEGKSVRLDCVIIGQPEPEVIWYHNGRPVKESVEVQLLFQGDRCSLLIQEAYMEDGGIYKVVAINSAGEASSQCTLSVIPLNDMEPATQISNQLNMIPGCVPQFNKMLQDVLVNEGDQVDLECIVNGEPRPTVKWYLNNEAIELNDRRRCVVKSDGTVNLTIDGIGFNEKGVYKIVATNSYGDAKCFSHVNVKQINQHHDVMPEQLQPEDFYICPTFKELFSDKNVRLEDCIKFECVVIGKPAPKVKWLFNDHPITGADFLVSRSNDRHILTIPCVRYETIGKISCIAENTIGKATCVGYLNLVDSRSTPISSTENKKYLEEYETGSSTVTIKKEITSSIETTHTSQIDNNFHQTQIIGSNPTNNESIGKIQLSEYHQSNDMPSSIEQKSVVSVVNHKDTEKTPMFRPKFERRNSAPRFITPLIGKIVDQGNDVTLEATVDGFPAPKIEVTKNGAPLVESDRISVVCQQNHIMINVKNVSASDSGRYACTATNNDGSATSTADLVVKKTIFPPVFGHRLQAQVIKKGARIKMDVEVSGTPNPVVTWLKDNIPLTKSMKRYHISQIGNNHTLIIEKADLTDAGKYMVRAINDGGEAHSIADFAVLEPTPDRYVEVVHTIVHDDKINQDVNSGTYIENKPQSRPESRGTLEETVTTEIKRCTEATMKMEHNLNFDDLKAPDTKAPSITRGIISDTPTKSQKVSETIDQLNNLPKLNFPIQSPEWSEHKESFKETSNFHYKTVSPNNFPISDRMPSPRPSSEGIAMEKLWSPRTDFKTQSFEAPKEMPKRNSVTFNETVTEKIIRESSTQSDYSDLKAPSLVRDVSNQMHSQEHLYTADMKPGTPPELCFAPRSENIENAPVKSQIKEEPRVVPIELESPLMNGKVFSESEYESDFSHSRTDWKPAVREDVKKPSLFTSGYMADTEDTFYRNSEFKQQKYETYHSSHIDKSTPIQNIITPVNQFKQSNEINWQSDTSMRSTDSKWSEFDHHQRVQTSTPKIKLPPPPSPSKFVKGEIKESDYESDYDGKIPVIWKPYDSDSEPCFRSIRPVLTPTQKKEPQYVQSPAPPSDFDVPPSFDGPPRPRFVPIERLDKFTRSRSAQPVYKPTPVSGLSQSQQGYKTTYYTAVAGPPMHNAIATELSNTMEMRESTERSHRVMNMSSTRKVIQYDMKDQRSYGNQTPEFSYTGRRDRLPPPPTPTKFIPGEFRESDYESEIESAKIRPLWTPNPSDTDEPHYRPVQPPSIMRSSSVPPRSYERVLTPMEFDNANPEMPSKITFTPIRKSPLVNILRTQTLDRYSSKKSNRTQKIRDDIGLQREPQPLYGYVPVSNNSMVTPRKQAEEMTSRFKSSAQKFIHDVSHDVQDHATTNGNSKAYREDSRVCQYELEAREQYSVTRSENMTPVNILSHQQLAQKRKPLFITPLKDIAVVAGTTARFECIIQSDPQTLITWSRNGQLLENGTKYIIEFRNGVCRLTVPEAYPCDTGMYECTGTNQMGSTTTAAELQVPAEKWGVRD